MESYESFFNERLNIAADEFILDNCPSYTEAFKAGVKWALQHQWMDIEEALPNEGELVFAIDSNQRYRVACFFGPHDCYHYTWEDEVTGDIVDNPTHWMKIPKY